MRKLITVFMLLATAILLGFSTLPAALAEFEESQDSALTKFERGTINATTGWMEMGTQTADGAEGPHPITGTIFGVGKGIFKGLQRVGTGLVDIVTFPLPPYNRDTDGPATLFGNPQ